jgi:hypothetical protein
MNNSCYRKCLWNYNNQCCPEDDQHYQDGTAHTNNCSQFLHKDYFKNMDNVLAECQLLPMELNIKQLRQARHSVKQIKDNKEFFVCGGYCRVCKHTTPCEAKDKRRF